jgi:TRAP-type mannitol/chloroaromatic compound transport system permease small subunit
VIRAKGASGGFLCPIPAEGAMKKFLSVIDAISIWSGKVASWLILLVVGFIIYEILMRYVFHLPTLWVSESMVFGAGLTYVLGAAWALQDNRHVKIDLIYGRLTPRQRAVMDSITFVFFALYMIVFLWATAEYARRSVSVLETSGSAWDPPVYPIKLALMAGVALLLLQGIAKFIRDLHFAIKGNQL